MLDGYKLIEIRELYNLSQTDLAKQIGYSREVVNKIESGKMKPSKWFVQAVSNYVNTHQISNSLSDVKILGKISQIGTKKTGSNYLNERQNQKNIPSHFLAPLVGIKVQAGYLKGYEHVDFLDTLEKYSLPPGVNPTGAVWSYFEVEGDSMEATFYAGDLILASMLPHEDWNEIKNFCVYVILTSEQLMVKRVYRKNEKQWILFSDNEELYPQIALPITDIKQVWTFRRHIRSKLPELKEFKITA